jgi:hypothetical protein
MSTKYNPEYYQRNKDKYSSASKKYYERIRAEKIARGEILTLEQKAARKEQSIIKARESARLRYQTNSEYRERCQAAYRERYHSDANFRKSKAEYFRQWRQSKKLEILT